MPSFAHLQNTKLHLFYLYDSLVLAFPIQQAHTRDPSVLQNDERAESNIILYAISSTEYEIYHACLFIASESMNT